MSKKLLSAYKNPTQPGSLGGAAEFAKEHGLSKAKVKQLLQQERSYTLHKPRRKHFPTLPVFVFDIDQQWVMDVVDLQKLAKWNQGNKYLLTVVDGLSKYAWVIPIKSKSGSQMVTALETLWKQAAPRKPQQVQNDAGAEFYNLKVQEFFKKLGVTHFSTHGDTKAAVVEAWNRTFKRIMFRYFKARNTLKQTDALPAFVRKYNHTEHSTAKEKPANVNAKTGKPFGINCMLNAYPRKKYRNVK